MGIRPVTFPCFNASFNSTRRCYGRDGKKIQRVTVYPKIQCTHCLEPACATACPIHAYNKTAEGAVAYNPDLCFGCRYCVIACPFNMPAYDYDRAVEPKIIKCFFCYDRIKEGKLTACADACPAGALT